MPLRIVAAVALAALAGCSRHDVDEHTGTHGTPGDDTDTGVDVVPPGALTPWTRSEEAASQSIAFDELLYAPTDPDLEWLELHNPMAIDVDLSGWSLEGPVSYAFADGTVLGAGQYLVVAADPTRLADDGVTALGPYDGDLPDDGARIDLRNNGGRLIDTVSYGDDEPWPVAAAGSGLSLAKADPDAASDHAESWTVSAGLGGTPGKANLLDPATSTTIDLVPMDATWRYDVSGSYPASDWASPGYDDAAWAAGQAIFYAGDAVGDATGTITATADNFYAVYLGAADGSDLRLVGEDADGSWTTPETFSVDVGPDDHLYVAAWEASTDYGGPQMAIAEADLPDDVVGTSASTFEWVLGPTNGCPGVTPTDPPPDEAEIAALIADAEADGTWAVPAAEADRSSSPWGWATSASFTDDAKYVWGDTFNDTSITNTSNTYVLFRSTEPLLGSRGTTELPSIPTTSTFRTTFSFDDDPSSAALTLQCLVDDGAVVWLNGVEVLRQDVPTGAVTASTLASSAVGDATTTSSTIPAGALVRGENVLAVEVHQATANDADLTFGCSLTAKITPETSHASVLLNEVAPASASPYWVELTDAASTSQDVGGLVLASSAGGELVLPDDAIGPGDVLEVDDVGFPVAAGDVLFLYSADRAALLDAVRVTDRPRARTEDAGPWRMPTRATPGDANVVGLHDDVVIDEIAYHDPEWIELYNKGANDVDLGGWMLADAVAYTFPAGTVLAPGGYLVVTGDDFSGHLDNDSDRILLEDADGNPADEVRYFDGGRWPEAADGGGSTLELRDPRADNSVAEAWAASDEGSRSAWQTYTYRGEAAPSVVGPDGQWNELVLGLLDGGEILLDDVSVIEDPDGAAKQVVQNGTFDAGDAHWRLLGNHRHGGVVPDPDDPSNPVLRVVATGGEGHMHNHVETTLTRPIRDVEYEISFRAKWITGDDQLNTRLYFDRLAHTTLVAMPEGSGTPGAANSTAVENIGPTFDDLAQDVAVPDPGEPVTIGVSADDPDGVASVTLWSSVDGGTFASQPMTEVRAGRWEGTLAGRSAGSIVQFYVEAEDGAGAVSTFPAAGPDSRALVTWDDGRAATNGLHNLRILLTPADSAWMHDAPNLMSDDLLPGTVVYDESRVFYDVGVRAKGSERGRVTQPRFGYGVSFRPDEPYRGHHSSVLVDRSEGVGYGQREVLMNLVMTHAGSVSGEYNDLIQAIPPVAAYTGPAELQLDRFTNLVLDAQFADGASGSLFEYELIYYPLTTDDGTAEGQKLPDPDWVVGTAITDLGDDPEAYRWTFLSKNNEQEDDYGRVIDLGKTFAASDFVTRAGDVIDVDEWLRAYAFATVSGAMDNYGGDGSQHNAAFYVRPDDQRVLYFPHDLDYIGGSTMPVVGNGDLARLLTDPANARTYYGHLEDIVSRAYNPGYLAPWCDQLEALTGQDFAGHCSFVGARAGWLMSGASDAVLAKYPKVAFAITTNDGADFAVSAAEVVLQGTGWVDVREIAVDGVPVDVTWVGDTTWQVTVPLADGENDLALVALDQHGDQVGSDSIVVTSGG